MQILVNIDVDDLQRGIDFYSGTLGLKLGRRFGDGGVELLGAPAPIYLLVKPAGSHAYPGGEEPRRYGRHWTPVHLDIVVDTPEEVDALAARAVSAGARPETPARSASWGRIATLADPFGHGLCILAFLNAGYDEIATN